MWYFGEVQNIKWRKDMVLVKDDKYYIIETKIDKTTAEAIE